VLKRGSPVRVLGRAPVSVVVHLRFTVAPLLALVNIDSLTIPLETGCPETQRAGPKARPLKRLGVSSCYQFPVLGHAPVSVVVHLRFTVAPLFAMVNRLFDAE
jgi:hypothetical protein